MFDPDRIRIVLVNPSHPGNIGASARAMKNMGLRDLVLVAPEEFPSGVAVGRAVSAVDILEQATVVATLEEAVADCALVIGTSARSRSLPWPMLTPEACAGTVLSEHRRNRVALVFGREVSGLNNEELQRCHFHVQISTDENCSSLNLAAAVLVLCYEVRKAALAQAKALASNKEALASNKETPASANEDPWDQEKATGEQVELFFEHLERVLVTIDFHDPDNPRQLLQRLRRLFGRIRMDVMEMNILRGILTHIEQRLSHRRDD